MVLRLIGYTTSGCKKDFFESVSDDLRVDAVVDLLHSYYRAKSWYKLTTNNAYISITNDYGAHLAVNLRHSTNAEFVKAVAGMVEVATNNATFTIQLLNSYAFECIKYTII